MKTLHDSILQALADSSSQMPVHLTTLAAQFVPKVKLAELTSMLDSMCESRELQTCDGFKEGKAYVCYWISGNLPPAWGKPTKSTAASVKAASSAKKKS